jgi:membrane peptidoglycan carboxypeptidase
MEGVIERGTGTAAQIPGYTIAGKTGTAAKLVNGRYSKSEYNASFVGFVPSRDPALAIIVVVDSPRSSRGYYGGVVAAPIFGRIAEASLRYLGIAPNVNPAPPVLVARDGRATPAAAAAQPAAPVVNLIANGRPDALPDLAGLSAREAMRLAVKLGLTPRLSGDGVVVSQNPPPGSSFDAGDVIRLELARIDARAGAATASR